MTDFDPIADMREAIETEKQDDFERSTLSFVLKQLGASTLMVKNWQSELGEAYNFDWFNSCGWIPPDVFAQRCFSFNLEEIISRPNKHPITLAFKEAADRSATDATCLVFKAYKWGRLIATNMRLQETTHIHVVAQCARDVTLAFNLTPFNHFLSERYGQPLKDMK